MLAEYQKWVYPQKSKYCFKVKKIKRFCQKYFCSAFWEVTL